MSDVPLIERRQTVAFAVLTLAQIVLATILSLSQASISQPYLGRIPGHPAGFFRPFFGQLSPMLALAVVAVAGWVCLSFLHSRCGFQIFRPRPVLPGFAVAGIVASLFGIAAVAAEVTRVFREPADMNVPLPYAGLFYPVVGYVVEVIFKTVPLALLLGVLGSSSLRLRGTPALSASRLVGLSMVLVALVEPIYQLSLEKPAFSWGHAYIGLHVFAINLVQLYLFRRYDFITMYSFRMIYYFIWHILWGYWRLQLLF